MNLNMNPAGDITREKTISRDFKIQYFFISSKIYPNG